MFCKCGKEIPEGRRKLGYRTCVSCSTEDKWGCSQVVFHKTGNTIEVIKDKELCETINAMAQRTAFGVCKGMTGTYRKKKVSASPRKRTQLLPKTYEGVGEEALVVLESDGLDKAVRCVAKYYKEGYITEKQKLKLTSMLRFITMH